MIDEGMTPPAGRSIAKELKEIQDSRPDRWTLAWWKSAMEEIQKAYRGLCHLLNIVVATTRDHESRMNEIQKQLDEAREEYRLVQAAIGETNAEIAALRKRVEEMSQWGTKVNQKLWPRDNLNDTVKS